MSGGIRVVFNGVRGSTPCAGPAVRTFRWSIVVRRARVRRCRADPVRPGNGPAPVLAALRRRVPRHGAALAPALGSRAGPAVLHAVAPPGFDVSTCSAPARTPAPLGDVFAQMMRPPFFPITPAQLTGDVRFHGTGEDDFPVGQRQGALAMGPPRGPDARVPRRPERRVRRVRPRPRSGLSSGARRRLHPARVARALRRCRPAHPRRAAHRRGVRAQAALGPLHRRLRGARRPRVGRAPVGVVPPRPCAQRRRSPRDRARRVATTRRTWARPR